MLQPVNGETRNGWKPLVVCPNASMALRVRSALSELGLEDTCLVSQYPRVGGMAGLAAQHGSNICFLDIASGPDQALNLIPEAASQLSVVALNPRKDADLILQCLRLGACEFLSDPTAEQVGELLERLSRLQAPPADNVKPGALICVLPGKPGAGASTLATYLAIEMKRCGASRVLLVDTDPVAGSVSFLLKLKPAFHVGDALRDWSRMDNDLWGRLAIARHGIDVLPAPEDSSLRLEIDPHAAPELAAFWRKQYEAIVLDAPGAHAPGCEFALLADEVLLVTANDLAALHATRRSMECLEKQGVDRTRIRLVVNRYDASSGLNREGVVAALKLEPYALLSNDWEEVQSAVLDGKPVAPASHFGRGIQVLAGRLLGKEAAVKKRSSLFGLLRK
jgi:pilus assembly protein CpaE